MKVQYQQGAIMTGAEDESSIQSDKVTLRQGWMDWRNTGLSHRRLGFVSRVKPIASVYCLKEVVI